ncbi:MAG: hypothetical protein ABSG81_10335 [Acidimicrobiales bacterium]
MHRPMTFSGLEACLAFGAASLAVMEAQRRAQASGRGRDDAHLGELLCAHDALRTLFADGGEGVPELALSVMVLAERMSASPP